MINKPPPFKGLNIRIPIIIPFKGRVSFNHGSRVWFWVQGSKNFMLRNLVGFTECACDEALAFESKVSQQPSKARFGVGFRV